jgi:hypothetical protein
MSVDPTGRSFPMTHDMGTAGAVMMTAMIVMMIVMGGFSLAFLARAVPGRWRGRIRHATRRPAGLLARGKEGTR